MRNLILLFMALIGTGCALCAQSAKCESVIKSLEASGKYLADKTPVTVSSTANGVYLVLKECPQKISYRGRSESNLFFGVSPVNRMLLSKPEWGENETSLANFFALLRVSSRLEKVIAIPALFSGEIQSPRLNKEGKDNQSAQVRKESDKVGHLACCIGYAVIRDLVVDPIYARQISR